MLATGSSVRDEVMRTSLGLLQPLKPNSLWQGHFDFRCCAKIGVFSRTLLELDSVACGLNFPSQILLLLGMSGLVTNILENCVYDLFHLSHPRGRNSIIQLTVCFTALLVV